MAGFYPPTPDAATAEFCERICGVVFRAAGWDAPGVMTNVSCDSLVVFRVGEHSFAVEVSVVERVLRAVEITPLPDAPHGVRGIIDLRGRIIPVFDMGSRFGQSSRPVRAGDQMVIARTQRRPVALLVDDVVGVVPRPAESLTPAAEILPGLASISGVLHLEGGLVLVQDIDRFLSLEDHAALELALSP